MKEIELSNGMVALVSDSDYDRLIVSDWYPMWTDSTCYGRRNPPNKGEEILMHRFILNAPKGAYVDHKDGNGLNNTRDNLRLCTQSQNLFNRDANANNKSGYKGVYQPTGKRGWTSRIQVDGEYIGLGVYSTPEEAAIAYNHAAVFHRGEFAFTNDIQGWQDVIPERRDELHATNSSGYRGVSWSRAASQWIATICADGQKLYLGKFDDPIEAARAYDAAVRKYRGESAKVNFKV